MNTENIIEGYSGYYAVQDILKLSASGGASYALSKTVLNNDGIVYGVGYSQDFTEAVYYEVTNELDLRVIQGSKYIHSKKKVWVERKFINVFSRVAQKLLDKRTVLFIGLGCDVGALIAFCEKRKIDTTNLITIDLICHGPTVSSVHEVFIRDLKRKYKSNISEFSLRYKKNGWSLPYIRVKFDNNKIFMQKWEDSDYCYAFGHFSKTACGLCKFKGGNHKSDITIGDYWGITRDMEGFNPDGVSVLLVHTDKGNKLIECIDKNIFCYRKASVNHILENNPMYCRSRDKDRTYKQFKKDLEKHGLKRAVQNDMGLFHYYIWKLKIFLKNFYRVTN